MANSSCPYCDIIVDQYGLQCDKCASWVHYSCTKLPPYMIIQFSKSSRVFTCHSCGHAKFITNFPELHGKIDEVIRLHIEKIALPLNQQVGSPLLSPPTPPPLPGTVILTSPTRGNTICGTNLPPSSPPPVPGRATRAIVTSVVGSRPTSTQPSQASISLPAPTKAVTSSAAKKNLQILYAGSLQIWQKRN